MKLAAGSSTACAPNDDVTAARSRTCQGQAARLRLFLPQHICSSLPHEVTLPLHVLKDELQLIWAQLPYKTQSPSISSVMPHINKTATMTTVS
jgi:hypothetical protein